MIRAVLGACALLLSSCAPTPKQAEVPEYFRVDPATAGTLSGKVRFAGTAPRLKTISMNAEAACETLHPDPVTEPGVLLSKAGDVRNVLVYIRSGLEGKRFEAPTQAVVLDQRGCMFVPRVVGLQTGQTLRVKNSDPVSHNVHPQPKNNREWNQHQAPDAPDLQRRFMRPEILIPVKCNIHSWMRSYIAAVDHPYFAVTGEDGGYEWRNVPAGNYTISAWHEVLGEAEQRISVEPGSKKTMAFTFR